MVAGAVSAQALTRDMEWLLARVDILEPVSQEEVRTLARYSTFAHLNASDDPIVVAAEEHAERLILLLDGRVRVYEEGFSGRQVTVSVVEGGTLVGATGFAFCSPLGLRVEALESSTICGVRRRVFEQLVDKNPTLGTRVARLFGERLIETQARLADLACKEVPERLASQILRLVESEGVVTREGYTILTRYTHQQLGSMIGANREAVTRALKELREQGGVDVRNRRIHVVNAEILRHTSE